MSGGIATVGRGGEGMSGRIATVGGGGRACRDALPR